MKWLKKSKGELLFLATLVFFAYFNSLNNEFVSDDIFTIVNNNFLGDFDQVVANPFYFLRLFEYWIVFNLFGKQAVFFRLINFLFHILATFGVYALVDLLSLNWSDKKQNNVSIKSTIGFIAAMLFAVHPLGVESVSWISAGGYVQMTAFALWALVFYWLTLKGKTSYYVWSLVCLVLALSVMESGVVVVGLMGLLSFLLGGLRKSWKYLILPVMLGLVWLGIAVLGVGVRQESLQVGLHDSSVTSLWLQVPVAVSEYLKLFVWPVGLTLYHSDLLFTGFSFAIRVLVFLGFLVGVFWSYVKNRKLFFWLAWFLVCLLPTLLPFGLSWVVAERYVYMAMIGLCVVVAMGFSCLKGKWGNDVANLVLVLVVGSFTFRTILRNNDWQQADNLWLSAERYSTLSPQNHNNLGDTYGNRGMFKLSRDHFLRAIELNPRYADAMHNLGSAYLRMGEVEKAKESYLNALEANPDLWQSKQQLEVIEKWEQDR